MLIRFRLTPGGLVRMAQSISPTVFVWMTHRPLVSRRRLTASSSRTTGASRAASSQYFSGWRICSVDWGGSLTAAWKFLPIMPPLPAMTASRLPRARNSIPQTYAPRRTVK